MATAVEDISSTKKKVTVEIPADVIEKEYSRALDNIRLKAKIPGFRPGKAPLTLIEQRFGSEIRSDILDKLVPQYYTSTMKSANLVPVDMPDIGGTLEIKRGEPLSFTLTVEVRPEISSLNYIGLKADAIKVDVTEAEVQETIVGLQEGRAMFEAVDRAVRDEDMLVIDYVKLDPSGEKELSSAKDQVMNLGKKLVPQAFADALVGRKKGDVVDITLPEVEGGQIKDEEEKGNKIRITVKEVKEKRLPDIDDELAKDFGHDSLEILREKVKEGLLKNKTEGAESKQKGMLLEQLIDSHTFDVPESLVARELETLVLNESHSKAPADPSKPDQAEQEAAAKLAEALRPKAIRNVKSSLLLETIAEKENVTVADDEVKARISLLARHFQSTPDAIINLFMTRDGSLENLSRSLREEKVLSLILAKAETKGA